MDKLIGWDKWFEMAKEYQQEHGNLKIPVRYKHLGSDGQIYPLGEWINSQRKAYKGKGRGKITQEQIKNLESIGMTWNHSESTWNEMYEKAEEYYKAKGNLSLSEGYKTADGKNLGTWVMTQKASYKHGKLSATRIKQLENIGIKWNADKWEILFAIAEKYSQKGGDMSIQNDLFIEGENLGAWLQRCRDNYNLGSLDSKKVERLDSIGMIW